MTKAMCMRILLMNEEISMFLTETEKTVLARGLRFCLPPKAVDRYEVKCSFELLYRDLVKYN